MLWPAWTAMSSALPGTPIPRDSVVMKGRHAPAILGSCLLVLPDVLHETRHAELLKTAHRLVSGPVVQVPSYALTKPAYCLSLCHPRL